MKALNELQSSDFTPYLNQIFTICLDGIEPIDLELIGVKESGWKSRPEARQPFALHFLGPASSQYLIQHIYQLAHDELGMLDLFLVPLGPESGRMRYEAVFS